MSCHGFYHDHTCECTREAVLIKLRDTERRAEQDNRSFSRSYDELHKRYEGLLKGFQALRSIQVTQPSGAVPVDAQPNEGPTPALAASTSSKVSPADCEHYALLVTDGPCPRCGAGAASTQTVTHFDVERLAMEYADKFKVVNDYAEYLRLINAFKAGYATGESEGLRATTFSESTPKDSHGK